MSATRPLPEVTLSHWINGARTAGKSARTGEVYNPATGDVIRRVPLANSADVAAAVAAAKQAFPGWRDTPALKRARVLMRFRERVEANRDELIHLISEEHGKTHEDAAGSLQRGIEVIEFAAGAPHLLKGEHAENVGRGVDCYSLRQPLGVCVGITPFNFPVMVPLWMFPVALACGNTFILKPSERVPSASLLLAELLHAAELPPGVFNVITGDKEAVDALLAHPDVAAVSFVGSTPVAKYIYETSARYGKRVQALGGAKNHAVVMPDADLEFAVDALVGAGYGSAGERCMAVSAVVAVGEAGDRLVPLLKQKIARLRIGAGNAAGVDMGPLITAAHRDRVRGFIDSGVADGATLALDGRNSVKEKSGFFLGPTLFDHVTPSMRIYREEIFGPVLIVVRAATLEDAIRLINANPYGNGTAIFTRSGDHARRFTHEIEIGMVGVNVPIPVPMAFFSFGGWKASLFGDLHVHGIDGIRFYTRTKAVTSRWPTTDDRGGAGLGMPTHG